MATQHYAEITKDGIGSVKILLDPREPVKQSFDKGLIILPIPKQSTPLVYLIDLKKLTETITIKGYLWRESSALKPYDKKQILRNILKEQGTMSLKWDDDDPDQPYTVNITKGEFTEKIGRVTGADEWGEGTDKSIYVNIIFAVGVNKG